VGAVRPETRYSYTQTSSQQGHLVYQLTGISACQALTSCTGAADEAKTTAQYNSDLLPTSVSQGDGTGTLTATNTFTYDARGNRLTVDGPLPVPQIRQPQYDAADQQIGTPRSGAGRQHHGAVHWYRPTVSEQGDRHDTGRLTAIFRNDRLKRSISLSTATPARDSSFGGGTAYALTQLSWRLACRLTVRRCAEHRHLRIASASRTLATGTPVWIALKTIYDTPAR
jgi:hypothetical protein